MVLTANPKPMVKKTIKDKDSSHINHPTQPTHTTTLMPDQTVPLQLGAC